MSVGGTVSGGGWNFMLNFRIIPGSVTPSMLRALKGPQGRCYTTQGEEIPGWPWPRIRVHFGQTFAKPNVSRTPGNWAQ